MSIGHCNLDIPKIMSIQKFIIQAITMSFEVALYVLLVEHFHFVKTEIIIKFLAKLEKYGIDIYKTLLTL